MPASAGKGFEGTLDLPVGQGLLTPLPVDKEQVFDKVTGFTDAFRLAYNFNFIATQDDPCADSGLYFTNRAVVFPAEIEDFIRGQLNNCLCSFNQCEFP